MKVGILNAIEPDASYNDWRKSPIDVYIRFFEQLNAPLEFARYEVSLGQFPKSIDDCGAYLVTGSIKGVYDEEAWIARLEQFIRDSYQAGKKLIGICFGHQIVAHALGGHAEKSHKGLRFGLSTFDVTGSKEWMNTKLDRCSLYFYHQDQVIDLPPKAELLGGNAFCPNAFYVIGDQVLGIQGHPEFSLEIMQDLLPYINGSVTPEEYYVAAETLHDGAPDNQVVAQWLVNFLTA